MPQKKIRNKLHPSEVAKINARYMSSYAKFNAMTAEEIIEYSKNKMSHTDKCALVEAFKAKQPVTTEVTDGNSTHEEE